MSNRLKQLETNQIHLNMGEPFAVSLYDKKYVDIGSNLFISFVVMASMSYLRMLEKCCHQFLLISVNYKSTLSKI